MVDLDEAEMLRKLAEDTCRQRVPMERGGLRFVAEVVPAMAEEIRRLRRAVERMSVRRNFGYYNCACPDYAAFVLAGGDPDGEPWAGPDDKGDDGDAGS